MTIQAAISCAIPCSNDEHKTDSASASKTLGDLEQQLTEQRLVASQSAGKVSLLEAALAAEQAKSAAAEAQSSELNSQLEVRMPLAHK